jgi:phage-related protein
VEGIEAVEDTINSIQSDFDSIVDDIANSIYQSIAGVQRIMRAPGRIYDDTLSKINGYYDMVSELCSSINKDIFATDQTQRLNNAKLLQSMAGFGVAALSEAATYTTFRTRSQSIEAVATVEAAYTLYVESMDAGKTDSFSGDHNFFNSLYEVVTKTRGIIIESAFDLKAEKTTVLKTASDIITECYAAYGNIQAETVDFFISTNRIIGDEFIEIPAGRSITVYV